MAGFSGEQSHVTRDESKDDGENGRVRGKE
jgi:hypothetical protein